MVAPLFVPIPPPLYGGTERVLWWLIEALSRRGHEVTLFGTGDSTTSATNAPFVERALCFGAGGRLIDPVALHLALAEAVRARADAFDVIHNHADYVCFPALNRASRPVVTTLHGRLDTVGLAEVHRAYPSPVVSISDAHREALPDARWVGTVYHGLPMDLYRPGEGRGGYALFLGRISPDKRPDVAIRAAREAGVRLVLAAKVDPVDQAWHDEHVAPLLREGGGAEFIGEVDDARKIELLRDASALLFPIAWPEPFGLVMIEAMACGAPVVATRYGSVPEVVDEGVTGFVCDDDVKALAGALDAAAKLDRRAVRARAEARFSDARMAEGYEAVYRSLIEGRS
ncbi:MAG: glycosyltransferase family 4 protein [Polyangiales bacterium]